MQLSITAAEANSNMQQAVDIITGVASQGDARLVEVIEEEETAEELCLQLNAHPDWLVATQQS